MNFTDNPKGSCPTCGARWVWLGRGDQWHVADKHGRSTLRSGKVVDGQPVSLAQCPECGAKVETAEVSR